MEHELAKLVHHVQHCETIVKFNRQPGAIFIWILVINKYSAQYRSMLCIVDE